MSKKLAAAAIAALVGATASAYAADMYGAPAGGYKDAPYVGNPLWAGYYIGANIGAALGDGAVSNLDQDPITRFHNEDTQLLGGVQFGFNYQRGPLVVGPEFDLGGIGFGHKVTEPGGGVATSLNSGFYGDITGRLGYAFGQALVYVKGGYAYFDGDFSFDNGTRYVARGFSGYTVGGGLEYKVSPAWSVKGEYQYMDFIDVSATLPDGSAYNLNLEVQTFKLGVNYHISGDYGSLK
jgi:outer membrane immunogenic protein